MTRLVVLALLALTPIASAQSPVTGDPVLPPSAIGDVLFVADFTADAVFALRDLNGDGDANDAGEIISYYDTTSPDPALHLATIRSLAIGPDGALYVGDANADFILRLEDIDGDGTANQAGEASIYYDAAGSAFGLTSISNMVFDADGYLYFSDTGTSSGTNRLVLRIRDDSGDGYCSEADSEVHLVYSRDTTTGTAIERPSGLAIDVDGSLIVSDYETDTLFRFVDTAGSEDGDADDAGEQELAFVSDPVGIALNFAEHIAFGPGPERPLLVNSGPVEDVIWRLVDTDGDRFYLNPDEVNAFWDITQSDGIIPANARTLAFTPSGVVFVIEAGSGAVEDAIVRLEDLNGDGDCNDAGEAAIYADNTNLSGIVFGQPQGMAWQLPAVAPPVVWIRGDCNADGAVNISDAITTLDGLFGSTVLDQCQDACDSNDDGNFDISDAIFSLAFLFTGGPDPSAPFPDCGEDPTADTLPECVAFPACP